MTRNHGFAIACLLSLNLLPVPYTGQQTSPPPCVTQSQVALIARWGQEEQSKVVRAIQENDQRRLQQYSCLSSDSVKRLDLRGISLENVDLEGPYVLQGADLSYANLRKTRINNGQLLQILLYRADISGIELVNTDISNSTFRHVYAKESPVSWTGVTANGVHFDSVFLPRAEIRRSTFSGAHLDYVDLSLSRLEDIIFDDVVSDRLNLWSASIERSRLRFQAGVRASLEQAVLNEVDLSRGYLLQPNLAVKRAGSTNTFGLHLRRPILRNLALDNFDWRYIIWDDYTLGDEEEVDPAQVSSQSDWRNREAEHRQIASLYSQISSVYRNLARESDANRFHYELREFQRRHEPPYNSIFQLVFFRFPDSYGTSGMQLLRCAFVSLLILAICFAVWNYLRVLLARSPKVPRRERFKEAWCVLVHRDPLTGALTSDKSDWATGTTLSPFRVTWVALIMSATSLLLFADKLLNIEGLLDETLGGAPRPLGFARFISAGGAIWGLYLAFRGIALLA